ncbi:hypothetical protein PVAP13_9KG526800 [Panicum virgatum]|uniref:Uncharacterized protein n=1 Tax=Panicum virgatum TaxID=38727 RepID=A0A8T0NUS1_PANVG|nr:hypothetical protein PVAP13_9KG526800 [Panicum virgatum]
MIQRAAAINGDSVRGTNHWSSRAQPLGKTARRSPEARAARIPSAGSRGWCCARHDARANFSRNPLLPPAGPEAQSLPRGLSLLGMPFSEAACALREGNYAPASRKDSSLALRPTPTAYLSIPSVKRVIRLAACQPQCTTNWRGRRVRSASSHRATRRSTIQHGVVPCVVGACAWRRPRRERGALGARTGCLCLVT